MDECQLRLLRLMECRGVGPAALRKILRNFAGTPPAAFFGRPPSWYRAAFELPSGVCAALAALPPDDAGAGRGSGGLPIRLVTCFDAAYPAALRGLPDAPPILSVFGRQEAITQGKITVLSSRGAESALGEALKSAWRSAVEGGWVPVAGHNRGVYQWGLLAAKRSAAGAVMVLDRGLLAAFDDDLRRDPVPAARIWGYGFEADRSLAVSPFRLRDPFIGRNNRIRDALVAALADLIVAIGVREGGWMHHLCLEALGRGQTVYASHECLALLADAGAREWTGAAPLTLGEQSAARSG